MKKFNKQFPLILLLSLSLVSFRPPEGDLPSGQYLIFAWNDLGMHCANQDFSNLCVLPPYNTQRSHVIQRGDSTHLPVVLTGQSGISVTYEIPGNSYSVGKTNFWSYAAHLFGDTLAPNIGLTGNGLTGSMTTSPTLNYQFAEGIPVTAYPDASLTVQSPYQLTMIRAFSPSGALLASTQSVIPVSHEINCIGSGCHVSELSILQHHDQVPGFNIADKPILCANCHSDNALGTPGQPGVDPFSQVMHMKHGEFIKTGTSADCYKCHPGPNTQCWRDVMHTSTGAITKCQDCHGSVFNVGKSIENGRIPWLQEPSCGSSNCHGAQFAEEPGKLFRESKGHGGLFCSACHNSPHAILPTSQPNDNLQNIALQGFAGTLSECSVCHGYTPAGNGPHGIPAIKVLQDVSIVAGQSNCYNATQTITTAGNGTTFSVQTGGNATLIAGRKIAFLPGTNVESGGYLHAWITSKGRYCNSTLPPMAPVLTVSPELVSPGYNNDLDFSIHPNPTTGNFTVQFTWKGHANGVQIFIYNETGKKISEALSAGQNTMQLSLSNFPAGIYLVRAITGSAESSRKVIRIN